MPQRLFVSAAIIILSQGSTCWAAADKVAIHAPVACEGAKNAAADAAGNKTLEDLFNNLSKIAPSCGSDLLMEKAQSSFDELANRRQECLEKQKNQPHAKTITCPLIKFYGVPAVDFDIIEILGIRHCPHHWAPVDKYEGGSVALKELLDRARNGSALGGYQVVESNDSKDSTRHLAICQVTNVSGIAGPPRNCVTVAIIAPDKTWLRGSFWTRGDSNPACPVAASFRLSGAINIYYDIKTRKSPIDFVQSIKSLLEDLGFTQEMRTVDDKEGDIIGVDFTSAASLRDSKILRDWRESADFDVSLHRVKDVIELRAVAHTMICRQALGNLVEYHGLDDNQRGVYVSTLDAKVGEAIKSACGVYKQNDARTILCD